MLAKLKVWIFFKHAAAQIAEQNRWRHGSQARHQNAKQQAKQRCNDHLSTNDVDDLHIAGVTPSSMMEAISLGMIISMMTSQIIKIGVRIEPGGIPLSHVRVFSASFIAPFRGRLFCFGLDGLGVVQDLVQHHAGSAISSGLRPCCRSCSKRSMLARMRSVVRPPLWGWRPATLSGHLSRPSGVEKPSCSMPLQDRRDAGTADGTHCSGYIALVDITVFRCSRHDDLAQQHTAHTGHPGVTSGCNAVSSSAAQHTGCMAEQRTEMLVYTQPSEPWLDFGQIMVTHFLIGSFC